MKFPTSFKELKDIIVNIWGPSIKSMRDSITIIEEDIEVIEEDVEEHTELIEENTEEILATKVEVQEVKDLLSILIFELVEQGIKIEHPKLIELLEEAEKILDYESTS